MHDAPLPRKPERALHRARGVAPRPADIRLPRDKAAPIPAISRGCTPRWAGSGARGGEGSGERRAQRPSLPGRCAREAQKPPRGSGGRRRCVRAAPRAPNARPRPGRSPSPAAELLSCSAAPHRSSGRALPCAAPDAVDAAQDGAASSASVHWAELCQRGGITHVTVLRRVGGSECGVSSRCPLSCFAR